MTGLVPEPVDGVPCETTPPAAPVPGPQRRGETGTDTGPAADDGDVPSPVAARDDMAALVGAAAPDAVAVPPPTTVPPTAPPTAVPDPRTEPDVGPVRSLTPEQGLLLEAEGFAYAVARGVGAPDARYFAKVASHAAVTRVPPLEEKAAIGYTIRAVRNQIADLRRTHPREVPVERFPDRATGDTTAEQVIRRDEVRRALRMVRELLTERQFEVFWLRRVKEMTLDETADILGIRPGTVAATLNKAERKIGRHLARQGARAPGRQRCHRG
ncbi:sigma-70 family RNA polymerase sigma factor [Streptomyces neyagawaensis]|uniref:sigma-70 family RNA polymerase sigma factor n=2 Tax=Streptomyces neyagawaensis TaxID=42238 RepID=UPI00201D0CB9|nr:sigma-70 family RNA polymerase sigma factor [Streptomyces neyagawaensis]MCL6731259.1 sigma-70 family RNA polymerase sigma factor [Streptomyces neyagawaensis]MDE1683617.1 sigma-70 family RNA polymerase sigma factor [Streptomyces neyagawaensis]